MKRVPLILFWIFTVTALCSAQGTFYYPQIANGVLAGSGTWKTTIFLTNPAASGTASGTITFTKENSTPGLAGSAFVISFTDENGAAAGSGNVITFSIAPGAVRKYVSSGTGDYAGGFATVTTTAGTAAGTALFSLLGPTNRLIAEGGVPAAPAVLKQSIFVDTVGGYNVGFAYANPGTASASVTLSLLNSSAQPVLSTVSALGPGNHRALFIGELFPAASQLTGSLQLNSTVPLTVVALRFDALSPVFTTLPPVTLAALINPAVEWLEHRRWLTPLTSVARLLEAFAIG